MLDSISVLSHLSPDTEIKCLQSLVNFIPVTISAKQNRYIISYVTVQGEIILATAMSDIYSLVCVHEV